MTAQPDLWNLDSRYPEAAGSKEATTSRDAADVLESTGRAAKLEAMALAWYKAGHQGTADDCAAGVGEEWWSIRPRVSQLYHRGFLVRTGRKKPNASGSPAHVMRLFP